MELEQNRNELETQQLETTVDVEEIEEVNLYPMFRHLFLTICILCTIVIIAFLIYQNGRNIYDNGI